MPDLAPALDAWDALPYPNDEYPPGSDEGEVVGEDLALLDGDVAAVLHVAIRGGSDWTSDWEAILAHAIPAMERVLPELSPTGRAYFGPALPLLLEVQRRRTIVLAADDRAPAEQTVNRPWFVVVGRPFPGTDPDYRGPDRDQPVIVEGMGPAYPPNRALLEIIEDPGQDEYIRSEAAAHNLARLYPADADPGSFEVIQIIDPESHPGSDRRLLGFDVLMEDSHTSLLAAILLQSESLSWTRTDEERRLRSESLERLNENRLFGSLEDADSFLESANATGPWEGPEISWWVRAIWFVPG